MGRTAGKTKKLALAGLFTAFSVILQCAGALIESNTLFLLAAAAFLCGAAARFCGILLGAGSMAAAFFLGLLLSPQKLYSLTFLGLAVFVLFLEWMDLRAAQGRPLKKALRVLFTMLLWTVVLALAFVAYRMLIGDVTQPLRQIFGDKLPGAVLLLLLFVAAEAAGYVLSLAYRSFMEWIFRMGKHGARQTGYFDGTGTSNNKSGGNKDGSDRIDSSKF